MPPTETKLSLSLLILFCFGASGSPAGHPRQLPNCGWTTSLNVGNVVAFTSPNYPYAYPQGLWCIWAANSPANTVIKMRCEHFSITPVQGCSIDIFYFSPSGDPSFQDAYYYCGNGLLELTTNSNAFAAGFYTNSYVSYNYPGFNCVLSVSTDGSSGGHTPNPNPQPNPVPGQVTDPPVTSDCNCGIKGTSRITGGQEAKLNEWPWACGIRHMDTGDIFCGATLINDRWLVTAAHCAEVYPKEQIYISLGDHNKYLTTETAYERHITVDTIILHEYYDPNTVDNDIAMLRLSGPVTLSDGIRPACLPFRYRNKNLNGAVGTALGWGQIEFNGETSSVLKEVNLPILSADECRNYDIIASSITNNMICTYKEGSDACKGDSGGPLVWSKNGYYQLVGITSFGKGCGDKDSPGVYTNVLKYLDWINQKVTSGSSLCSPA